MNGMDSERWSGCTATAFPTLDTDLDDGSGDLPGTTKRVCIATPGIMALVKNGGIATAYHHLARLLAEQGHEVVIAYVNGNATDTRRMEQARALYAGFGVTFEPVVPRPASVTALAKMSAPTWALYDWLRATERPFDVVHVSDWHGLGYGVLLAKSLGIAFGVTHFIVHGHGPSLWNTEGNHQLVSTRQEMGWVFMEQRSVELADTVTCGSENLLQWMRDAGYAMPARSFVWPNPFPVPDSSPEAAVERAAREGAKLEEVVFFGRLEPRKGLVLFVRAVDRLVRQGRAPARVTFLGVQPARYDGLGLIRKHEAYWPIEVNAVTSFGPEEAVAYLSRPGRLAVLPSLQENASLAVTECLHAGIPFITTATGGTPELIAPEDRARVLVAPDHIALGDRIAESAAAPLRAVRPRWDFGRSREVWSLWHARTAPFESTSERFAARALTVDAEPAPLVTVCIVHYEQPLVRMAVDSVVAQDYAALEAVLVDDGSESAEALAVLEEVETAFSARGWRVVRQENRYLGAARNAGVAEARGEWLLFLDDDDVLYPDAVSRMVYAARFSGADCVPAASTRFSCNHSDPRTDARSHGTPIRFIGAARNSNFFDNVVGGACALIRREAFDAVGGFSEEYGVALEDHELLNRLILRGFQVEPFPDPVHYYRMRQGTMLGLMQDSHIATASRFRALSPYIDGLSAQERAFASFSVSCIHALDRPEASWDMLPRQENGVEKSPNRHVMALAQLGSRFGLAKLEVGILFSPGWLNEISRLHNREPILELRRNGWILAQVPVHERLHDNTVQIIVGSRIPAALDVLYTLHDLLTGEVLTGLMVPASRRARRIESFVEDRPRPHVRGWILDPGCPERHRRVAIHLDGCLREVLRADELRDDIARWKGTDGRHGFLWHVPEGLAMTEGTRIDVFDADTGLPLRGSPKQIMSGQVAAIESLENGAGVGHVS